MTNRISYLYESFCKEITLESNANDLNDLAERITLWANEWARKHRHWESPLFEHVGGSLDFFEDFAAPPICRVGLPNTIIVRLQGTPEARKYWKDWLALRFIPDMRKE